MRIVLPADYDFKTLLSQGTGLTVDLIEVGINSQKPYMLITPMPTADYYGGIGSPNSMGQLLYQVDVIGINADQVRQAEERMLRVIDEEWATMPTVLGPFGVRRQGSSREDDRTFKATYTITIPVGA